MRTRNRPCQCQLDSLSLWPACHCWDQRNSFEPQADLRPMPPVSYVQMPLSAAREMPACYVGARSRPVAKSSRRPGRRVPPNSMMRPPSRPKKGSSISLRLSSPDDPKQEPLGLILNLALPALRSSSLLHLDCFVLYAARQSSQRIPSSEPKGDESIKTENRHGSFYP